MIYVLDFRGAEVGGPVLPGRLLEGTEDLLRLESKVTFLLHGFNVNRTDGRGKLKRLATDLSSTTGGAMIPTLWPGDHWVGPLSYSFEGRDADDTAVELARFISRVIPAGTPVSFVAHSLGSRVVMETVTHLFGSAYRIEQICLLAAAVDDYSISSPSAFRGAAESCSRVAVLSSKRDKVLRFAYPLGDFFQAFLFFWKDTAGLALGYHGPKADSRSGLSVPGSIFHSPIPMPRNADHGDYLPPPDPGEPLNAEQVSTVQFIQEALANIRHPQYP